MDHFSFFERIEVSAFISRKLNKLRRPFFTFPDKFTPSILLAKISHLGSRFGGYSAHKMLSEPKISKVLLFRTASVPKWLELGVQWYYSLVEQRTRN